MHITLTGNLGSGKSTICKILEGSYGFEVYSTGKVQRKLAADLGMSVLEMNQLMCSDPKYDKMIDDTTAKISRENRDKKIVFDSRLAWHFVEKSFKVFLTVSLDEAAKRVFADCRGEVETYVSVEDARAQLKLRAETETVRYQDIYHLNYFKLSNYDLILDATFCTPKILAEVILSEAKRVQETENITTKLLISPKRLGVKDAILAENPKVFYPADNVVIHKEEDFVVECGQDIVERAGREGTPFVQGLL